MIDFATLAVFSGAVLLLLLSPGPNMAFVISHGISHGWRGGLAASLGIGVADIVLTVLTATGVTAVVAGWPPSFDLIRYAGVGYLLWLAFKTVQKRPGNAVAAVEPVALKRVFLHAMLNSLLNSASAIDTSFNSQQRQVQLRQGEIQVTTGADSRPFWVMTRDGYLRTVDSRLLVREAPQGTWLAVQRGTVAVFAERDAPRARQLIKPGEQVVFNRHGIRPATANGLDPWAWSDGVISARNMRLDDFLAELARYRNGLVRCSEAVADLRVSGTYQLDDTDQVLNLVAQSLKVDVTYRSRYWVTLSPRV